MTADEIEVGYSAQLVFDIPANQPRQIPILPGAVNLLTNRPGWDHNGYCEPDSLIWRRSVSEKLKRSTRVTGLDRSKLATALAKRYEAGESIRSLAASTGRSYGFVHRILAETGVLLRRGRSGRRASRAGIAAMRRRTRASRRSQFRSSWQTRHPVLRSRKRCGRCYSCQGLKTSVRANL